MKKQTASGKCIFCAQPKLEHSSRCRKHFFANVAIGALKSSKFAEGLEKLFNEQNGKCYLTGRLLVLGVNASIDHLRPLCQQGPSSLENVKWCDKEVNRAKSGMTVEQFVALCKEVTTQLSI